MGASYTENMFRGDMHLQRRFSYGTDVAMVWRRISPETMNNAMQNLNKGRKRNAPPVAPLPFGGPVLPVRP